MGCSLMKNAYNLGVAGCVECAIERVWASHRRIFLKRNWMPGSATAARRYVIEYSMTTLDIPATGYSLCYELGIFKQRIVDGQQVQLPDDWKMVMHG